MILDLLVRRDPADKQKIHEPVVENLIQHGMRRGIRQPRRIHCNRHHAGLFEAKLVELVPVVLRIAQADVGRIRKRRQQDCGHDDVVLFAHTVVSVAPPPCPECGAEQPTRLISLISGLTGSGRPAVSAGGGCGCGGACACGR